MTPLPETDAELIALMARQAEILRRFVRAFALSGKENDNDRHPRPRP